MTGEMIAFGPVPSRRLGRSLGINNIPPKVCTYSCVYCQLGRTDKMSNRRREFLHPDAIVAAVTEKVHRLQSQGEKLDFLTFVPDGEPTLDIHLEEEIRRLRPLGYKIAVISNATLVDLEDVRQALALADWVSLKIDAVSEDAWRRVDRPHRSLCLDDILKGILTFAETYSGQLVTETMLVAGLNDGPDELAALAAFLGTLKPAIAYLALPTRPPAEPWVRAPDIASVHRAYQVVCQRVPAVELLMGYEGNAFTATGNTEQDLLSMTAVHPMRSDAVESVLKRNGDGWSVVERLIREGQLVQLDHEGWHYYLRRLHPAQTRSRVAPSG